MKISPNDLSSLLERTIPARLPTLTIGAPGIGKSDIHAQVAAQLGCEFRAIYPALLDPTDMSGLPIPVGVGPDRRVERLLDNLLSELIAAPRPILILLDELGQASPAMQAACAPLLLSRSIAGRKISENVAICAATNRRRDHAGAGHLLIHLLSRMSTIVELSPDMEGWCKWAVLAGIRPEIISFIRFRPALLACSDSDLEKAYFEGAAYPCPRTWVHASKLLDSGIPGGIELPVLAGALGEGAATELLAHLRLYRSKIDIDEILRGGKLPEGPAAMYAVASGAAARASGKTGRAILSLAERLSAENLAEYAVLLLRDSLAIFPEIASGEKWISLVAGPLGKAIRNG